jgi:hypothetical protein
MGSRKNIWKAVGIPERNTPDSGSLAEKVFQKKQSKELYHEYGQSNQKIGNFLCFSPKHLVLSFASIYTYFLLAQNEVMPADYMDTSFGPVFLLNRLMTL